MLIQEINESNFLEERNRGAADVEAKFKRYDDLKARASSLSENDFKTELAELFKDPTIWAYATLKDPQNNPLKLYPFQDRFINDPHRFTHCTAANQIGKTLGSEVK